MVAEKSGPSFASILTIASIVMYTGGFVRIELEFNKQKDKIHQLESAVESMKTSNDDIAQVNTILRNRRSDYSMNNKTENKRTSHETFTPGKLVSELRQKLCQSNTDRGCQGLPGPPGPPGQRGESGERGRRGSKGKTGNKGDNGIMGPPGKSGKQGVMGPPVSKGEAGLKGKKGDTGYAGMKGAKGEPGESIAAPTVAVSPAKMTVNESKTACFQCSVSGNPKPVSTWSKLEGKSEKILSATTNGKLILPNVAGSDSGVYKCSASNILGQQAQALVHLVVNVHPRISLNPGPRHAIKGSKFTLPICNVTGHPTPVVTWKKSSGLLAQGRVRYNNSMLQILQVRKEDSDFYICSAENLVGRVEKKTLLVVVSLPQFTSKPPSKIVSILNCTVSLSCSAIGDPQPTISWRKQGGQLPVGRSQQISGALVITNLQQSDAGNYICTATSISVFRDVETVSTLEIQKAALTSSSILVSLDKKYLIKLNSFLAPVLRSSSCSRFVRCWRAKTDGWAASTFHSNCDGKGPTVVIIQVGSYIFGGYTDLSWSGSCGPASSSKSFIYSLYNINDFSPVKLQIKSGMQGYAIYRCSLYGLRFGYLGDISISNNAASNRNSFTYCGHAYHLPPGYSLYGYSCRFYAGSYYFTPTDVEVFYETFRTTQALLREPNTVSFPQEVDPHLLANSFGDFFVKKIESINKSLNDVRTVPMTVELDEVPPAEASFSEFESLSDDEVYMLIKKAAKKSCLLDPMPTYLILQLLDVLLPVITTMINLSFNTGYFAHAWKEALVLPSLKKPGLDVAFKNFRPVSNLPYISKLSERAAACQLTQYMTDNDLHSVFQSAYKPNHSTETALLKVKNDILMNMNDQHVTLLVLLDLGAAFDTVHHDILIARLKNDLGIEGDALSWLISYLSDRSQRISINGGTSRKFPIVYGVPQGSCLGPLLFTVYTRKLFQVVKKHLPKIHCYADDTQLYLSFCPSSSVNAEVAVESMNDCIADIRNWMISDKLVLNDDKTEFILIGTRQQLAKVDIDSISVGSYDVSPGSVVRNLGSWFEV
ncbi:uncharacterized protein LOC122947345 [Acropora millepora]|uniref:uncharacterized protein LOC122947345 n=1 Tax=Acropora millepora TaxID=45264 RepID=UPI001CF45CDE|nr:uncharacterized protein LOC122947345 [Acropora millepora]